jgi:hypothetical protein
LIEQLSVTRVVIYDKTESLIKPGLEMWKVCEIKEYFACVVAML